MTYKENKVENLQIAYIGGGSRGWAWGLMSDLASEEQLSGTVKLYDIDHEAAKANAIIGNSLKGREDVVGHWNYEQVGSLKEALIGADFVVISILPGTFEEMRSDVHVPEKYGIYQPVGDTVGPGGIVRALRTVPMYVEIAKAIKEYSPEAWVINFTNPMTVCTRTLYEIFPEVKAFGNCHEVFGTQALLANALEDIKGIEDVTRDEIKVKVIGINHFTWITEATYKGMDLFPLYKEFVDKYYETGFEKKSDHWMNSYFGSANRVKFDLFRRYGLIAAAGDRHLAEFVPNKWYLKDEETVEQWKFRLTPVDYRTDRQGKLIAKSLRLQSGEETFELKETGEEGVRQIKALLGLEDLMTNVNLPNRGQIEGLPIGAVVETNAIFQKDRVTPVMAGQLPYDVHNLVSRHVYKQEAIIKAVLEKDLDLAFRVFVNDPLTNLSLDEAEACFKEMIDNTKEYLEF